MDHVPTTGRYTSDDSDHHIRLSLTHSSEAAVFRISESDHVLHRMHANSNAQLSTVTIIITVTEAGTTVQSHLSTLLNVCAS